MHKFNPAHIERLLNGSRLREVRPRQLLLDAGLRRAEVFIDIGSGPGFFTLPAARIVGPGGVAYAVDTEPRMLDELKKRKPPANVKCILSSESSVPLPDNTADFLLLVHVLHEAEDRVAFLLELKRLLKPGAKLLVIDWKKRKEEHGPPIWDRITLKELTQELKQAGFSGIKSLPFKNNPSHYRVIARK
ncbi:MAG: class I SAM-dependent methyltransferase [Thermodesulfobacteriota bacterium]